MTGLTLDRLSLRHPGAARPALEELSLEMAQGEMLALLGPSGCGKTTALRVVAGLIQPDSGDVRFDGASVLHLPPERREAVLVFQSGQLFAHMDVAANVGFGLRMQRRPRAEIAERVAEALDQVQLRDLGHRQPHELSGGQRQRVALARSLAKAPKLLLLDEPLGALDRKLREETQFELMDIQEKTGTTFVIVTHDQEEAMTVASRIAVMDEGHLVQVATPAEIYEAPNSVYVADFIGDVNILQGRATPQGDGVSIDWAEGQPPIRAATDTTFSPGQACHFAVRPEKVTIDVERPDRPNTFRGKVIDIAYLGNISTYHVELAGGHRMKAQMVNARRLANRQITWEDEVWVGFTDTAGVVLEE